MSMVAQVGESRVDSFDVEETILAFLADAGRLSLELPHMTTGQRKHARCVVDNHPGQLRCESYGFGPERRLHVFKEAAPPLAFGEVGSAPPLLFGDVAQLDGNGPDDIHGLTVQDHGSGGLVGTDHASAPATFRSMPEAAQMARLTQMAKGVHGSDTTASARRLDLSAINEVACNAEVPSPGRSSTSASGDNIEKSSCASASAEGDCGTGGAFGESVSAERDMPALPQAYTVRNTFIHIDGEEADAAEIRRVVQSMPHGMFKQSLQDELAAARHMLPPPPEKAPTMPSTPTDMSFAPASIMAPNLMRFFPTEPYMHGVLPVDPFMMMPTLPPFAPTDGATDAGVATEACGAFSPGSEVIVVGLLKAPAFNGLRGIVQSLDADTGRYSVLLIEGARQWAKVKGENLRWAIPPPPSIHPNLIDASSFATGTPVLQLTSLV